jgi:hypothetical protein
VIGVVKKCGETASAVGVATRSASAESNVCDESLLVEANNIYSNREPSPNTTNRERAGDPKGVSLTCAKVDEPRAEP